jgi:hypothetical protein
VRGAGHFGGVQECGKAALECGLARSKMIMVIMLEGKVIMRLPSTGGKVIKMLTYMEMGDTCDGYDTCDSLRRMGAAAGGEARPGVSGLDGFVLRARTGVGRVRHTGVGLIERGATGRGNPRVG